jgi:hypothetical protein
MLYAHEKAARKAAKQGSYILAIDAMSKTIEFYARFMQLLLHSKNAEDNVES